MHTVLITGANRGIGLEHVRQYAERGAKVFAGVRAPGEAHELLALTGTHPDRIVIVPYDARDAAAPSVVKSALGGAPLDLLLANAGIIGDRNRRLGDLDYDDIRHAIDVNALAPLRLAEALADHVARSGRKVMAFQSSLMGSIADNGSGGYYAYRLSKVSLNMIARSVAKDLRGRGVISVALHPGWVQTRMGGPSAKISTAECVRGQQRLIDALTPEQSGGFFNYDGRELPW